MAEIRFKWDGEWYRTDLEKCSPLIRGEGGWKMVQTPTGRVITVGTEGEFQRLWGNLEAAERILLATELGEEVTEEGWEFVKEYDPCVEI